jgi:zinc transport system substrate-binding protein
MKKIFIIFAIIAIMVLTIACDGSDTPDTPDTSPTPNVTNTPGGNDDPPPTDSPPRVVNSLNIVATTFPQYDWTQQILGELAEYMDITLLQSSSIDLHSFQPSVNDMIKISTCDLFIYIGGVSDAWVEDALNGATNENMVVINLLEVLGDAAKYEEELDGPDDDHHHHHHHDHDHNGDDDHEYDEHVWLSIRNARVFSRAIADVLVLLDPENVDIYEANLTEYVEKLETLDDEFIEITDKYDDKVMLFADRFPFRYLMDDYDITYYAAFSGCSAETEASFQTIMFLARKVDELGLHDIIVTESSDKSIANTVIRETESSDQEIHVLNSMQSVTLSETQAGVTFLSIMLENLEVFKAVSRNWS